MTERRTDRRIPVELNLIQYVDNRPIECVVSDLSLSGLHASHALAPLSRSSRQLQLELELPGLEDPLWVKGEVVYDSISPTHHGTGIRFLAMAPHHKEILETWLNQESQAA